MSATKATKAAKTQTTNAKKTAPKKPTKASAPKPAAKKKLSALDAAAQVLAASGTSMNTEELIEAMAQKKLWLSPNGKTPAQTLYAAILRELTTKGANSRFQKTEPGKFAATGPAETTEQPATVAKTTKGTKVKTTKAAKQKPASKKDVEPAPAEAAIPDGTPGPESLQELFRI